MLNYKALLKKYQKNFTNKQQLAQQQKKPSSNPSADNVEKEDASTNKKKTKDGAVDADFEVVDE